MLIAGWLEAQEQPDAADAAYILGHYDDHFDDWTVREIAYWDRDAIPGEAFRHIVRIIADAVAPAFGDEALTEVDGESGQPVSMGKKGWNGLRRLIERKPTGLPTMAEFF
jgi:hypothetical protein